MALKNLSDWNEVKAQADKGTACGAGKPAEKPAACGSACGAGKPEEKPESEKKPAACGSACGAGK